MNNIKYIKYLVKHKFFVTRECFKKGLYWRGLSHDFSKILPSEWIAYREYFYPKTCCGEKVFEDFYLEENFNMAWLKHQHRNKHHWQYWVLRNDDGTTVPMEMPEQYATEMVCDWIGANMAITGKREVCLWYSANKHKMLLHDATRKLVEDLLQDELPEGLAL